MPRPVFQSLVIIFLSFFTIDFAISGVEEKYKKRLKGWEGIAFHCGSERKHEKQMCATIETDAEFLATASGINFSNEKDWGKLFSLQDSKNYLLLTINITLVASSSTNTRCNSCAYFVNLKAYAFYINGIDVSRNNLPDSPMTIPRSGDFVLWESEPGRVFTGPWGSARNGVIKNVEDELKKFFTLFMKANPK